MFLQRFMTCGVVLACCTTAHAGLIHRYSFTSDVTDSVGGAHGTVVDYGAPSAVFTGDKLDLSANTGQQYSGLFPIDTYVDLPNGMFLNAVNQGVQGQMTIEAWAQSSQNRPFATLFTAGASSAGEDTSYGAPYNDYIQIMPDGFFGITTLTHAGSTTVDGYVTNFPAMSTSQTTHIASVYDQSGGLPGTVTLYVNGQLIGSAPIAAGLILGQLVDYNNWLGRSQWNDPIFDGSYDEFRVYDTALGGNAVAKNFQLGPDLLPQIGDLNGDGFVGIEDLSIVLGAWNQTVPPGNPLADPSGDGFVGIEDLNTVLGNWNAGTPPGDAVVPEPTTIVPLLGLLHMCLARRSAATVPAA